MRGRSLWQVNDGDRGAISGEAGWRAAAFVAIGLVVLFGWLLLRPDDTAEDPGPVTNATPTVGATTPEPTSTVTSTPTPTPTATPTPTSIPSLAEGTTVLFNGGPATGPWQQIGSVAEITHPDAPESASYSYRTVWSDPAEEMQPDSLWDDLVSEVAARATQLGDPVDRPVFGGAEGSESFNAFGGVEDIDAERELLTALWVVTFEDEEGVGAAYFGFLLDFNNQVLESQGPFIVREASTPTHAAATDLALDWIRGWSGVGP